MQGVYTEVMLLKYCVASRKSTLRS